MFVSGPPAISEISFQLRVAYIVPSSPLPNTKWSCYRALSESAAQWSKTSGTELIGVGTQSTLGSETFLPNV